MIVPMTIDHAVYVSRNMKARSLNAIEPLLFCFDPVEFAIERFMTDGLKMAAIAEDGTPVGIGGIQLNRPLVWTVWAAGTDRWGECGREIIYATRRYTRKLLEDGEACQRIQALVVTEDIPARRYVELVGFQHESDMPFSRKDGGSISMYAMTKKEAT